MIKSKFHKTVYNKNMKNYLIKINYACEVFENTEKEAIDLFWNSILHSEKNIKKFIKEATTISIITHSQKPSN